MFGGTGTVAVVSHKNDRKFIHIDISNEYCKTAQNRLDSVKKQKMQQKLPSK